jgi:O-antigen/teichoic acid export membrane protein
MAWTNDLELTSMTAPILSILAIGFLFNMLMWMPHETMLAHGNSRLPLIISIFQVVIILPSLLVITPAYGAMGAAYIWMMLCMGYFVVGSLLIFPKIHPINKWKWLLNDVLKPLLPSCLILVMADLLNYQARDVFERLLYIALILIAMILISTSSAALIRVKFLNIFKHTIFR